MVRGKGEGSIFRDARGLWTGTIELPSRDGKRRRKTVRRKSKAELMKELRVLRKQFEESGDLETVSYTVAQWMAEWYRTIASQKNRPKTLATYRSLIANEIIPVLGKIRLDKLTPTHVKNLNLGIAAQGKHSSAGQTYRILSSALKYAVREGKVARNVANLVDPPPAAAKHLTVLNLDQALTVLDEATRDEQYGSLWAAVLLIGAREGELLGLEIDRVSDVLELSWQLQRISWEHGCGETGQLDGKGKPIYRCGRKRGTDCLQKKITAPPNTELRHITGGLWFTRPKTKSGWRIPPLVDPLRTIIADHLAATADQPNPYGLVWHKPNGQPIDPREMNEWWHALLDRAGVPQTRVHDGRHATVDLLLLAGVPLDVIKEILGHSTRAMSEAYKSRENAARRIDAMHSLGELIEKRKALRAGTAIAGELEQLDAAFNRPA